MNPRPRKRDLDATADDDEPNAPAPLAVLVAGCRCIARAGDLLRGSGPLIYEDTVKSVWRAWRGSLSPSDAPLPAEQDGSSTSVSTDHAAESHP